MAVSNKVTCKDAVFCRVLILSAGDAATAVTALAERLLARAVAQGLRR